MKKLKLEDVLEYSIYHDNFSKTESIYGINKGTPSKKFFSIKNKKYFFNEFNDIFNSKLDNNIKKINHKSVALCSGGVDSSLISIFLKKHNKKFIAYHSYYPGHEKNDLKKIKNLKNYINFKTNYFAIDQKQYLDGLLESWKYNYYGNTYAPTLYSMFKKKLNKEIKYLITGSGPDEIFYGMEKYNIKKFLDLSHLRIEKSLEILDVTYNFNNYIFILNKKGRKIYENIKQKRKKLYKDISKISRDIFNAQRILAYLTTTNQHMEMFNILAKNKNIKHLAPIMDKDIIQFSLSLDLKNFLDFNSKYKDTNCGKIPLKKILAELTSNKHAFSNKIGFYSPVSSFLKNDSVTLNLLSKMNMENLNEIFEIKKLKLLIKKELNKKNYFIYSLLNTDKKLGKALF